MKILAEYGGEYGVLEGEELENILVECADHTNITNQIYTKEEKCEIFIDAVILATTDETDTLSDEDIELIREWYMSRY